MKKKKVRFKVVVNATTLWTWVYSYAQAHTFAVYRYNKMLREALAT